MENSIEEIEAILLLRSRVLEIFDVKNVILYGSILKGSFTDKSDIDLVYNLNSMQSYKCQHKDIRFFFSKMFVRRIEVVPEDIVRNSLNNPKVHGLDTYCTWLNTPKKEVWHTVVK